MFISPKYDECMKELFRNEIVRKYFISDVLEIPVEKIVSVRLANTFLWKRQKNEKQGILDVVVEMNDDTKINIGLQVKVVKCWDRRQLFYICKLYTADLYIGERYEKLKRCVGISILDFNLTEDEDYHNVYRLRNDKGHVFSDRIEVHTIELRKKLKGNDPLNDWIRFFNAESEGDLDMIKSKNMGIREAIRELREMSLPYRIRMKYEAHQKYIRDQMAREDYVRDEGRMEGRIEGELKGVQALIETCQDLGLSKEETGTRVRQKFTLSETEISQYMELYWK